MLAEVLKLKHFKNTFSSLSVRNYKLYFIGQNISVAGTFMQTVALAWLVLTLTGSGLALGTVIAMQFLPSLFLAHFGGIIADRFSKRKILIITQSLYALLVLIFSILVYAQMVKLWMIYVFALSLGLVIVVNNPAKHSFIIEMVGKDKLRNAITLDATSFNLSRIIGPAIAGILIATIGITLCFFINALSYIAVIASLLMMDEKKLYSEKPVVKKKGQFIEGLRYIKSNRVLMTAIIMLMIVGTLSYEFSVSLPLLAEFTFKSGATGYAMLLGAFGVGAVIGGLLSAANKNASVKMLIAFSALFGAAMIITSFMPSLMLAMIVIFFVGFFSMLFTTIVRSIMQLESKPEMRGRVAAFWSMGVVGSTAIGGPIIGYIGDYIGPRWGLAFGGIAAIIAALIGFILIRSNSSSKKKTARQSKHI